MHGLELVVAFYLRPSMGMADTRWRPKMNTQSKSLLLYNDLIWSGVDIFINVEKRMGGAFKTHPVYRISEKELPEKVLNNFQ
jgi:hypothetical protein